jgi:predicted metal-dependent RNase
LVFKGNFEYDEIVKPELCGQLVSTERYRNQWSTSENMAKKNSLKLQRENKLKKFIEKFIDDFVKINGREPIESEIVDNLKEQLDIEKIKEIFNKILNEKQKEIPATNVLTTEPVKLTKLDSNAHMLSMDISDLPI